MLVKPRVREEEQRLSRGTLRLHRRRRDNGQRDHDEKNGTHVYQIFTRSDGGRYSLSPGFRSNAV